MIGTSHHGPVVGHADLDLERVREMDVLHAQ